FGIFFEHLTQGGVGLLGVGFHIDQQDDFRTMGIDSSAIASRPFAQRVQVKRLQRALRFHLIAVVCDEQFAIDQPDIGFHAAKPAFERAEYRPLVLAVLVGVGLLQGLGRLALWQAVWRLGS